MRNIGSAGVLGILLLAGAAACGAAETDEVESSEGAATKGTSEWATPAWSERAEWYRTPQGSHLVDYDVFLALERAGSKTPFASRETLEPMGFVYADETAWNGNARLPLGVVEDRNEKEGRDYVGFTCAACHTGELKVGDKRVLVDGGQAFLEVERFFDGLKAAIDTTITDPARKQRFCKTLGGTTEKCTERLVEAKERVDGIQARNVVTVESGPGRMDAISRILNEVFAGQLGGEAAQPVSVPISIPHVWDAPKLSCVQTNCLSRNSFTRNIGEVLGVFGHVAIGKSGPTSSIKPENLYVLEKSLESLESPKWDERIFGKLDVKLRARGEDLFAKTCAGCHAEPYKRGAAPEHFVTEKGAGKTILLDKVNVVPYREVGTDPAFVEDHGRRTVVKPELTAFFDGLVRQSVAKSMGAPLDSPQVAAAFDALKADQTAKGVRRGDGGIAALAMLGAVTTALELSVLPELAKGGDIEAARRRVEFYRAPEGTLDPATYRARPLNGIAFTAPYGHNGAWPSLRDVLEPAAERPAKFPVRARSFDPVRVGIDVSPPKSGEKVFVFDTSKRGNLRTGHEYGTTLSAADKDAIVEYLKSL